LKIRIGLVSNSSSSSYLVAGFYINPITEPSDDYYEWWDKNEENRVKLAKRLREETGLDISVYDPCISTKPGSPLIVGHKLGYGDSPISVRVNDIEKVLAIIDKMEALRQEFALTNYASRNDCVRIIAGEEGNE